MGPEKPLREEVIKNLLCTFSRPPCKGHWTEIYDTVKHFFRFAFSLTLTSCEVLLHYLVEAATPLSKYGAVKWFTAHRWLSWLSTGLLRGRS